MSADFRALGRSLSEDGKILHQDLQEIFEAVRDFVVAKNGDNLIQTFIHQTRNADHLQTWDDEAICWQQGELVSSNTSMKGSNLLEMCKEIFWLSLTNGQFRKLGIYLLRS